MNRTLYWGLILIVCKVAFSTLYVSGDDYFQSEEDNNPNEIEECFGDNEECLKQPSKNPETLILSHVLFRHGNRTPDSYQEMYPEDPYLNNSFYPYGLGQLTNAGKLREFTIGTTLRQRYNSFLSDMFVPEEVDATTTDYNRTKASLQLVLAGLFPPNEEQMWNRNLMWQPVPYNYAPRNQDRILNAVLCPNFLNMYRKVQESWEMRSHFKKFRKVFNYVSRFSGLNVTTFQDIYNLYFGLSTEEEFGLILPDWTQNVWPQMITDIAIREYSVIMAKPDMRRVASGYFLRKIIEDSKSKIYGKGDPRKIYLYSAHENNIAQFLILLDVFRPHVPNYGAHVIVEVHKVDGVFGVMVFYQNWENSEPELLQIRGCGEFCPFEEFVRIMEKYVPENTDLCDRIGST
ncbi:venom acid phosphatase Acph-1-like [Euwallacea fornicatus]|uniref:venom acid phosphatase Acph-1-like n=1 Tax=Euwallacea fornicatus TaxID=995702 RepID=UPI00338E6212